jgi:hypothetical protein
MTKQQKILDPTTVYPGTEVAMHRAVYQIQPDHSLRRLDKVRRKKRPGVTFSTSEKRRSFSDRKAL